MSGQFMMIDNMPVEINGEKNLLDLIRKTGIELPTFCYYSELSVYGACRMCMVENSRGGGLLYAAACGDGNLYQHAKASEISQDDFGAAALQSLQLLHDL